MWLMNKIFKYFSEETQKKTYIYCRRCGRRLTNEESKVLGIGTSCYKKEVLNKYKNKLF